MVIEAILFDFGQTLVDSADGFRLAEKQAQVRLAADLGLSPKGPFLEVYRRLRTEFQQSSNYSRKSIWAAVYQHHGRQGNAEVLERWERAYWDQVTAETKPFPEAAEVLAQLRTNFRLGLVSNTQDHANSQEHRLSQFPEIKEAFSSIVIAGDGNIPPKPDQAAFHCCLERLGVDANLAVYVGDDWRNDILGSQDAGLHSVWLKHHTVRRRWPDVQPTVPVITSLKSLLDLDRLLG